MIEFSEVGVMSHFSPIISFQPIMEKICLQYFAFSFPHNKILVWGIGTSPKLRSAFILNFHLWTTTWEQKMV